MMSHGPRKRSNWKYSPLDSRHLSKLNVRISYTILCLLTVILVLVSLLYLKVDSLGHQCLLLKMSCIQSGQNQHNSTPARTFLWNDTRLDILHMEQFHFDTRFKNPCWFEPLISPDPYQRNIYSSYSSAVKRLLKQMTLLWRKRLSHNVSSSYRLRCLPYFYIIGQPKSGSTDLFWRISRHPDVVTPPIKEFHWWSRGRQGRQVGYSDLIPLENYIDMFDKVAFLIESRSSSQGSSSSPFPVITGEASVSLFWDNPDWYNYPENQHFLEPQYTNPDYIHHLLPDVKLILIVRNPTDRLYSDYLYFTETNKSVKNFHKAVVKATNLYNNCTRMRSVRECVYDEHLAMKSEPGFQYVNHIYAMVDQEYASVLQICEFDWLRWQATTSSQIKLLKFEHCFYMIKTKRAHNLNELINKIFSTTHPCLCEYLSLKYTCNGLCLSRLRLGLYSVYLDDWLRVFERNQILILRLEDYAVNRENTMNNIFKFLKLRDLSSEKMKYILEKPIENQRSIYNHQLGNMLPETRKLLDDYFSPFNKHFAELVNDQRFLWKELR